MPDQDRTGEPGGQHGHGLALPALQGRPRGAHPVDECVLVGVHAWRSIGSRGRQHECVAYRVLRAADAFWRPSNQTGVDNTDLAKQLEAETMGARLWRLRPGQAITRHRHRETNELYVLLEGEGKLRVEDELLVLAPLDTVHVEPGHVRQPFNDTDADQLWLVVGAPPEAANTLEMTPEQLAELYPDGPKAMPPELS